MNTDIITNENIRKHSFLVDMYDDDYFPEFLVDKCKGILIHLCEEIESKHPSKADDLYQLTHSATEKINFLSDEFFDNDSEIETSARECLAEEFEFIARTYGIEADLEKMISNRDW